MITKNEISSLTLSPTKKDFVQIWTELIEVASKITERWDPTSTNESDPGIVLLKALAGIADKLNYNIDKNILEAYMPTAAQMESMRKLCELVGYNVKYYQSAETKVRISYTGNTTDLSAENEEKLPEPGGLPLPKFTTITNADKDKIFITTNEVPVVFKNNKPWVEVSCIEGQLSQCESVNENNLITLAQLDNNNRYYLPEIQIAENGIFVYNALTVAGTSDFYDGDSWTSVTNLNTQPARSRVFKFGYDSYEGRPYLEFPEDVGSIIGNGLFIYFVRTSGLSGNISARTLEIIEIPTNEDWADYSAEQFEVVNVDAATNGANIESISSAYSNFRKTVGTFDTLVTCRDYMNKIYTLMDANNYPLVSNILVTDIRNDINDAMTLCSCNEYGILYKEEPLTVTVPSYSKIYTEDKTSHPLYRLHLENSDTPEERPLIDHFDLRLYPFKSFTQVSSGVKDLVTPYNKSFTYTDALNNEIGAALEDFKTCAHKLEPPADGDIVSINNYLRLNALIATSVRVTEPEAKDILNNVKVALVNEFNLRNLDFGEEIPFDSILAVIENADSRIKVVSLQEPAVLTTYSVKAYDTSKEYGIASKAEIDADITEGTYKNTIYNVTYKEKDGTYCTTAKEIYNKLVLRNILAGRASLFNYDEGFVTNNSEKPYTVIKKLTIDELTTELQQVINDIQPQKPQDDIDKIILPVKQALESKLASDPNSEISPVIAYRDEPVLLISPEGDVFKGIKGGPLTAQYTISLEKVESEEDPKVYTIEAKPVIDVYETYEPYEELETIDNIARIEAVCEIENNTGTFEDIELKQNEVIKFRAPNLITTKTFPAYVYYNFTRENSTGTGGGSGSAEETEARYAQAMSLSSFIKNVDEEGKGKPDTFFKKLWELSEKPESIKLTGFDPKAEINLVKINREDFLGNISQRESLAKLINSSIMLGANNEFFASISNINTYLEDNSGITELEFQYYPMLQGTMQIWCDCVKELIPKLNTTFPNLPEETKLWRLSQTSNHPKGEYVVMSHQRLYAQGGEFLLNSRVGDSTYICLDPGEDAKTSSVAKGSDVQLGSGDKLYIHYTPSSVNEDGETVTAEPVSIVYEGGGEEPVIIKPSFKLVPSDEVNRQGTSWRKTGVDFNGTAVNLMALSPNEQIELRSISKVVLNTPARLYKNFDNKDLELGHSEKQISYELKDGEYLFYTDQNTQEAAYYGSGSVITLDKGAYIPKTSAEDRVEVSQILEQGLHIIPWSNHVPLNDNTKITITEYQYRTLVEGDTLKTLLLAGGETKLSSNWVKCDQTTPITYATAGSEQDTTLPIIEIQDGESLGWEVCSLLELSTAPGYAQPLRATGSVTASEVSSLPETSETPATFGMKRSATTVSSDTTTDTTTGTSQLTENQTTITNQIKIYKDKGTGLSSDPIVIAPVKTDTLGSNATQYETVSVKLNAVAQSASGSVEIDNKSSTEDEETKRPTNVVMKVFKEEPSAILTLDTADEIPTPISSKPSVSIEKASDTVNNYWTKVDIGRLMPIQQANKSLPQALNLNFMVPANSDLFGIFSIYLAASENTLDAASKHNIPIEGSRVFIDIPREFGKSYEDTLVIFNYKKVDAEDSNKTHYWWTNGVDSKNSNRLYLRAGLNCIRIKKSCSLLIKAESGAAGTIIYDNMRLVKGKNISGINLDLLDFNVNSITGEEEDSEVLAKGILEKIAKLDKNHDFYYNAPVENSLAIEFDDNISSFSNPYTLYDVNNINNNFVISKLDIKYLDTGLKIAKSSKY